jgi:hypothetical protein
VQRPHALRQRGAEAGLFHPADEVVLERHELI